MHDINPLGTTMHLRELDRQAIPRVRAARVQKPANLDRVATVATFIVLLRRLHAGFASVRTHAH